MTRIAAEHIYTNRIWKRLGELADKAKEEEIDDLLAKLIQVAYIDARAEGRGKPKSERADGFEAMAHGVSMPVIRANVTKYAPGIDSDDLCKYIQEIALIAESTGYERGRGDGRTTMFNPHHYVYAAEVRELLFSNKNEQIVLYAKDWITRVFGDGLIEGKIEFLATQR